MPTKRSPAASPPAPAARRRGRPPASPEAQAEVRRRLIEATRRAFEQVGYHGLGVELIVSEAGLSRPTFYKHFRNAREPLEEFVAASVDELSTSVLHGLSSTNELLGRVEAALVAWRDWGASLGPTLRPIYEERHDSQSPVSEHRRRALPAIRAVMLAIIDAMGRPRPSNLELDAFMNGIEFLGFHFHLETDGDEVAWKQTRDAMFRLALAFLGGEAEWADALALAASLDVELRPSGSSA